MAGGTLKAVDPVNNGVANIHVPVVLAAGATSTLRTVTTPSPGSLFRDLRLNQSLSGGGALIIDNDGTNFGGRVSVFAADTHSGGTTVNAFSTLQYFIPGTFSGFASDIVNNGRVNFVMNGSFDRAITGSGRIFRNGDTDLGSFWLH